MVDSLSNLQVRDLLNDCHASNDIDLESDLIDQAESETSWGNKRLNFKQHKAKNKNQSIESFEIDEGPIQKSPTIDYSNMHKHSKMTDIIKPQSNMDTPEQRISSLASLTHDRSTGVNKGAIDDTQNVSSFGHSGKINCKYYLILIFCSVYNS